MPVNIIKLSSDGTNLNNISTPSQSLCIQVANKLKRVDQSVHSIIEIGRFHEKESNQVLYTLIDKSNINKLINKHHTKFNNGLNWFFW